MDAPDPIELGLFSARLAAACDEMGAVLRRASLSPNIRERLDFSCAVFDARGRLAAQAAHIPVHLGSMAYAMADVVRAHDWEPGDAMVFNDPFLGGTHLPDVTLVAPLFTGDALAGFVANRAHHADIGASTPGSMPLSTHLDEEGVLIPPSLLARAGRLDQELFDSILSQLVNAQRARGDFTAQLSANMSGVQRLEQLIKAMGADRYAAALDAVNAHAAQLAQASLSRLPPGRFYFEDYLDDDGAGTESPRICVALEIDSTGVRIDFAGTSPQTPGNLNCPLPVTAAAAWYAFRCLMPADVPACHGAFETLEIFAQEGSLVHARRPAAVAAGNVETSQRIVDAILGALAVPAPERVCAAAQGTMNNVALGGEGWDYYETIGGGLGAHAQGAGLSAVQAHMTNTRNTPAEVLEMDLPLRVRKLAVRRGSGGPGLHRGGDGMVREIEFLAPSTVTVISERRVYAPWGLAGGQPGACGRNLVNGDLQPGKFSRALAVGDRLLIESPGGGGYGI